MKDKCIYKSLLQAADDLTAFVITDNNVRIGSQEQSYFFDQGDYLVNLPM